MTVLVGRVTTGVGDLALWMRRYRDAYREATGIGLVPGSLNVQLEREYPLPDADGIRLTADAVGREVRLVPC